MGQHQFDIAFPHQSQMCVPQFLIGKIELLKACQVKFTQLAQGQGFRMLGFIVEKFRDAGQSIEAFQESLFLCGIVPGLL